MDPPELSTSQMGLQSQSKPKSRRDPLRGKACELVRVVRFYLGGRGFTTAGAPLNLGFPTYLGISRVKHHQQSLQVSKPSSSKAGRVRTETESLDNPVQSLDHLPREPSMPQLVTPQKMGPSMTFNRFYTSHPNLHGFSWPSRLDGILDVLARTIHHMRHLWVLFKPGPWSQKVPKDWMA